MNTREAWTQFAKSSGDPVPKRRQNKYGAQKFLVDGIAFDSVREADRYQELKLLMAAGLISNLEIHPGFPLQVVELFREGPPWTIDTIGMYHADFKYLDLHAGMWVVEDVKSKATKTEAYKLRKRIVESVHGIAIREIE
jgi:hypothetical protein